MSSEQKRWQLGGLVHCQHNTQQALSRFAVGEVSPERVVWLDVAPGTFTVSPETQAIEDEFNALESRITQLEADLEEAQEVVVKLATHAGHYGNCPLSSWNRRLTKCACGLFQTLSRLTPSPESSEAGQ